MIFQHQGHAKAYSFNVSQIHVLQAIARQPLQLAINDYIG
jgi:hypothetical protein